eukprot:1180894-Prorocentrum_minimum.AAC.2
MCRGRSDCKRKFCPPHQGDMHTRCIWRAVSGGKPARERRGPPPPPPPPRCRCPRPSRNPTGSTPPPKAGARPQRPPRGLGKGGPLSKAGTTPKELAVSCNDSRWKWRTLEFSVMRKVLMGVLIMHICRSRTASLAGSKEV